MKATMNHLALLGKLFFSCLVLVATLLLLNSCKDDPEPVNPEELITTLTVVLTPTGAAPVTLKFYDADGEIGSIAPVKTVSGAFAANTTYNGAITLLNEAEDPDENITAEIQAEDEDHLFCFTVTTANVTVTATDMDSNGRPVGLASQWTTGAASTGKVKIVLRHQPGGKTGTCPGPGDTDIEVDFDIVVQ